MGALVIFKGGVWRYAATGQIVEGQLPPLPPFDPPAFVTGEPDGDWLAKCNLQNSERPNHEQECMDHLLTRPRVRVAEQHWWFVNHAALNSGHIIVPDPGRICEINVAIVDVFTAANAAVKFVRQPGNNPLGTVSADTVGANYLDQELIKEPLGPGQSLQVIADPPTMSVGAMQIIVGIDVPTGPGTHTINYTNATWSQPTNQGRWLILYGDPDWQRTINVSVTPTMLNSSTGTQWNMYGGSAPSVGSTVGTLNVPNPFPPFVIAAGNVSVFVVNQAVTNMGEGTVTVQA
jgi:hypothetical protein